MEKTSKQSLERLLDLLDDLCALDENQWFKEALSSKFSNNMGFANFPAFLKHQKNQFRIKGRSMYATVSDKKLKKQLIEDYVEMSWYQSINNINRFILFTFYQMENLLNYYLSVSNAFEKIKANRDYFTYQYGDNFTIIASDGFFYKDKSKPIEKINIWAKLTFWMLDTNEVDWEKENHFNISNLINIRNVNSHRSSNTNSENVNNTIDFLKKSDLSSLGFFIKILKKIVDSLKSVNPKIKNYEIRTGRSTLPGVKQVGKIDLSKYKR